MDISVFITLFHIIGVALGVGGATVSDLLFFRALADKRISRDEFALLHTLGYILWAGLIILFLSGVSFVTYQLVLTGSSTYLVSDWFWAKMTIVFVLFCNALMMHMKVFPFMTAHLDAPLSYANMHDKFVLLAITGTLSITSWYSAMILGVTRGFDFSYGLIINTYALVVIGGILIAYLLFVVVLFPKKFSTLAPATPPTRRTPRPLVGVLLAVLIGIILVIAAWYGAKLATPKEEVESNEVTTEIFTGESHVVCIIESMPWFNPTVVRVAVGDTVIWDHCHDELGFTAPTPSFGASVLSLLGTPALAEEVVTWPEAYTHTHAIVSVSGPVSFSSDFVPVGHVYEGAGLMVTFTEPGNYEYTSPTHQYMRGQVIVGTEDSEPLAWPPPIAATESLVPATPGVGEVWVALQFARAFGQIDPGAIAILDTTTWQVTNVLETAAFHNPYQLMYASTTDTVFSTQWHSDRVVAIARTDKSISDSERLGNAPAQIVAHPIRDEMLVAMHNESRVAVLNNRGQWLRDIKVPFGPHGLAVSHDGQYLAVVSSLSGEFTLVSLESEQIVHLLDMPGSPQEVIFTPDDAYALVTSYRTDTLQVVDVATGVLVRDIALAPQSQGLVVDPTGQQVWVAQAGGDTIEVISLDDWTLAASIEVASSPHSIAFGPKADGGYYAYVTHRLARTLTVIDAAAQTVVGQIPLGSEGVGGAGLLVLDISVSGPTADFTGEFE